MKHYFYHEVPKNMTGNILYPLNELEARLPAIYQYQVAKYHDRKELLQLPIPPLNCLWNDVIFMAAVHPQVVVEAFASCGLKMSREYSYYVIDIDQLNPTKLGVYQGVLDASTTIENFSMFDSAKIETYTSLPNDVYKHYKRVKERSVKFYFPYAFIPHMLYKGSIDISKAQIIKV